MSATNSTANYELPIFLATDKPAWLTDWNGAMNAIDTAIHTAQAAADGAQTTASAATADISTINASLTTITGNITSLTTSVNSNTGAINTINSLIGNGEPTTTDKTLIGAINEIYGMITGGGDPVEAENVAYDNTTSGLTADDVQSAIDEVVTMLPVGPTPSQYDFNLTAHTGTFTITPETGYNVDSARSDISFALNDDYSIGKIYGALFLTGASQGTVGSWNKIATLTASGYAPSVSTPFRINIGCFTIFATNGGEWKDALMISLYFTGNNIEVHVNPSRQISDNCFWSIDLTPAILFLSDYGD